MIFAQYVREIAVSFESEPADASAEAERIVAATRTSASIAYEDDGSWHRLPLSRAALPGPLFATSQAHGTGRQYSRVTRTLRFKVAGCPFTKSPQISAVRVVRSPVTQPSPIAQSLRVFVASPGGVELERGAVRVIAGELNVALLPHGWQVLVLGWEQRGPAGGRPQADINGDVRACDIFLGLLGDRWGTPTGDHLSGFEEEWTIALDRHQASGRPDLWLYFKELPDDLAEKRGDDETQQERVLEFRRKIEDGELAFYKTFADLEEFTRLVRMRLLSKLLERSGLTRTDIGGVAIDWAAAVEQEPVDLVPEGRTRLTLVNELEQSMPAEAATLAVDLADDIERHGFAPTAEEMRQRACRVWLAAGKSAEAIALMRRILASRVWDLRIEEAGMLLRDLRERLPPEVALEMHTWDACLDAPHKPGESAQVLNEGLRAQHGFPLDKETVSLWHAVRWRALLDVGAPEKVVSEELTVEPRHGGVQLELALLRADALRAAEDNRAEEAWRELHLLAVHAATEQPELAAWITTRAALDAIAREDLIAAEVAYADAATRWTNVPGATANAALAFFSAQAAVQLRRDWSFSGWNWRPIAAQQRGGATGLAARAEQLEREALYKRLDKSTGAQGLLHAAIWCYARTGFIHGVMRCKALLADAYTEEGDEVRAIAMHCYIAQRSDAERLAAKARDGRAVADRMAERSATWSAESRFAVIACVGSDARPSIAALLAREVLEAIDQGERRELDNTSSQAAKALAMLAVAVEDPTLFHSVAGKLTELAHDERYTQANAGRLGLRLLHDIGRIDAADLLVARFASDRWPTEPDPMWVAEHLDTPQRLEWVRRAALAGHMHAVAALIDAGITQHDEPIRALCVHATEYFIASNIGMTPDGSGVYGLMALDLNGRMAAAAGDAQLRHAAGERLLIYAAASRWPMVNRVSAVRGLYAIAKEGGEPDWLERLKPLANPDRDLDEEADRHTREMWAERGDLEAMALTVCALLGASNPPDWLKNAVGEARLDARAPLRESAWHAAAERIEWFDPASARHALRDDDARVRVAALHAWRAHDTPLPRADLQRLATDRSPAVRATVVRFLETYPDEQFVEMLQRDPDAYIRGIARIRLGSAI